MATTVTPTRLLESPSVVTAEIDRRLEEDGFSPSSSDEEKILYIWKLFINAENDLQTAKVKEEQLKRSQTEEMQEVENYVEHIRHLSDEREALIQELETENDQLKQDVERYRLEQNASALRDETAEMLIQQGLEEIAQAPTSEQIAFLLVERARLLDELEAEQVRSQSAASDGRASTELQQTLEKEREDFQATQEEMAQQRELTKSEADQMKKEHEEEINVVMDENARLEDELTDVKDKVQTLESKLKDVEGELKKERANHEKEREGFVSPDPRASPRQRPPSPARSPSDVALRQIISEKTKLEGEILGYKQKIRTNENDASNFKEQITKMEKEKEGMQMMNSQLQMKNKSLKSELEETEQQLDESEALYDGLKQERDTLKNTVNTMTTDYSNLQSEAQKSNFLSESVERLNLENKELTSELESVKHEMDSIIAEKDELVHQKLDLSKSEIQLSNEIQTLRSELNFSKTAKLRYSQQGQELSDTRTLLQSKSFEYDELNVSTEQLNKENKDLLNRLELLHSELETSKKESQGLVKQEIIMGHMREQNTKLTKEVEDLKTHLTEKREELEDTTAESSKHKNNVNDIKAKLQLTLNELGKAKSVVEQERSENSELTCRLLELEQQLDDASKLNETKVFSLMETQSKVTELEEMLSDKLELEDELEERSRRTSQLEGDLEELEAVKIELEDSRDLLDQEKRSRSQLERKFQDLEQVFEDQKLESENIQQSLTAKVKLLENRVQALQDDLFAAQDELTEAQEKYEQAVDESQAAAVDLQERLSLEEVKSLQLAVRQDETKTVSQRLEAQKLENLEKQIESMKVRINDLQREKDAVTKERDSLLTTKDAISKERDALVKEKDTYMTDRDKLKTEKDNISREKDSIVREKDAVSRERDSLQREIKLMRDTNRSFTSHTEDTDLMRKELDSVRRELEHLQTSAMYDGEDRQKHLDRIRSLEDYSRQLELDNRELANRLQETLVKYEQTEESYHREQRGTMDRQQVNNRQLIQVEADLGIANGKIRELRDELHKHQNQIVKQEADKVGHSAKSDSSIARLEAELNELKTFHRKEVEKLTNKVDQTTKEAKDLKNSAREKDQELLSKQHELKRLKTQMDRLEAQLQTEIKIRTDLENRNTSLDQEISKVWGQVRTLMEKNASLEGSKRNMEDELERKSSSVRQAESSYTQSKASHQSSLSAISTRADAAEKRADTLQRELQETSIKLQSVQSQIYQAESCKSDLQDKKDKVANLKSQLDGEKLQRSLLDQTVTELQQQVQMMRQREGKLLEQNRDLQHTVLDLESKMEDIHDRNQTAFEMDNSAPWANNIANNNQQQHMSEVGKRSMMEQILKLQKDIKDLQYELLSVNERREVLDRRYEDRKLRTKSKLLKAREFYTKEKVRVQDQVNRMDEDLRLTRATLRKELDWKDKMDGNYKQLLSEKREHLTQLNEQEEDIREKSRMVAILQVRTKFLEEENSRLQERIDSLCHQKHGLDKLLKEQKLGKERENSKLRPSSPCDNPHSITIATSGLGNSISSMWDHDNLGEPIINYRTASTNDTGIEPGLDAELDVELDSLEHPLDDIDTGPDVVLNGYLGTSFTGGTIGDSIDLYRDMGSGSESEFDDEPFDV